MAASSTRAQQAYTHLHERIATGTLEPGAVVSEASLAKELGISRTPIGEALRRLAHEGLVEQVPRFGTIVREISTTELIELFEIREALEGLAAGKAATLMTAETQDELETVCDTIEREIEAARQSGAEILEGESLRRFLATDLAFHMLIIASADNKRLFDMIHQTRSISLTFKTRRGEHSIARVEQAAQAHRRILEAIRAREPEAASRLVGEHIRTSREQSFSDPAKQKTSVSVQSLNLPEYIKQELAGLNP
ncbi:putative HTH-type transcriptional regulator YdfH [Pseudobythopirellula maris]|uniref:Putative HTH-type transcriptional regulator YdfH n=1 Tax=Pseudobythopirellula maris TaxID=2527991 RepID=A0A5C5ZUZ4_9BACT|nr:GntR family transcriptional regulator [Pseudobythopirellula maris]TWT91060.1 putative HTH-type transcriptional regulator YdfH [Pseudobythopirellula maris]